MRVGIHPSGRESPGRYKYVRPPSAHCSTPWLRSLSSSTWSSGYDTASSSGRTAVLDVTDEDLAPLDLDRAVVRQRLQLRVHQLVEVLGQRDAAELLEGGDRVAAGVEEDLL